MNACSVGSIHIPLALAHNVYLLPVFCYRSVRISLNANRLFEHGWGYVPKQFLHLPLTAGRNALEFEARFDPVEVLPLLTPTCRFVAHLAWGNKGVQVLHNLTVDEPDPCHPTDTFWKRYTFEIGT